MQKSTQTNPRYFRALASLQRARRGYTGYRRGKKMRYAFAVLLTLVACVASDKGSAKDNAKDKVRHFRADHLTGGSYYILDGSGNYELIAREHMGIMKIETGSWKQSEDRLVFRPADKSGKEYDAQVVSYRNTTFLVWNSDPPMGVRIKLEDIKHDLDEESGYLPSHVFFAIPASQFRKEMNSNYPFRFLKR
jgi:hypothetical protein